MNNPQVSTTDTEAVLAAVGPRLRALRKQRDITLSDLSETTGISLSTLSRLESGGRRPTLEQLLPLAKAYQVQLDDLVGAPRTGDPRVVLAPVKRHGMTFIPLTGRAGGLQAYKMILPVTPAAPTPTLRRYKCKTVSARRSRACLKTYAGKA